MRNEPIYEPALSVLTQHVCRSDTLTLGHVEISIDKRLGVHANACAWIKLVHGDDVCIPPLQIPVYEQNYYVVRRLRPQYLKRGVQVCT